MALTHKEYYASDRAGKTLLRPVVKNPSVVTASGIFVDLTVFGRYPAAQYYTEGAVGSAQALRRSTHGGIDHGADKGAGFQKFLKGFTLLSVTAAAAPLFVVVQDHLLYYPLIPMDAGVQVLSNPVGLPRYTSGEGVQAMLVQQFPYVGGVTGQLTYTSSAGVAGRLSGIFTINTQAALGTVATSAPATAGCHGPFITLQGRDKGVRSVESIQWFSDDVGVVALVLVMPLVPFGMYEATAPAMWEFKKDLELMPRIIDDAYLSAICQPAGSLSGAILQGDITTMWNEV